MTPLFRCPAARLVLAGALCGLLLGCGGGKYEAEFDRSLKHAQSTGQLRPRTDPPPAENPVPGDAAQGDAGAAQPTQ